MYAISSQFQTDKAGNTHADTYCRDIALHGHATGRMNILIFEKTEETTYTHVAAVEFAQ